jgi:hypothetical protein
MTDTLGSYSKCIHNKGAKLDDNPTTSDSIHFFVQELCRNCDQRQSSNSPRTRKAKRSLTLAAKTLVEPLLGELGVDIETRIG